MYRNSCLHTLTYNWKRGFYLHWNKVFFITTRIKLINIISVFVNTKWIQGPNMHALSFMTQNHFFIKLIQNLLVSVNKRKTLKTSVLRNNTAKMCVSFGFLLYLFEWFKRNNICTLFILQKWWQFLIKWGEINFCLTCLLLWRDMKYRE